jgi:outer membrane biosynthesis protein TonB
LEAVPDPYADGETEIREFEDPGAATDQARRQIEGETGSPEARDPADAGDMAVEASPGEIADHVVDDARGSRGGTPGRTPTYKNLLSGVGRRGGLSFNTYDWDFAPYMLAMKRAIQSHLFPPYAFTHMGLVSGTNIIHFTVMPDGRIRGLEILGSDAHFSLDRTSVRAIESSVPFLPLPRDFPEEVLEVTAHFSYVIRGGE